MIPGMKPFQLNVHFSKDPMPALPGVVVDGDGYTCATMKVRPFGLTMHYGDRLACFTDEAGTKYKLWFPITDRRVARRIARKTGRKFVKRGRRYEF